MVIICTIISLNTLFIVITFIISIRSVCRQQNYCGEFRISLFFFHSHHHNSINCFFQKLRGYGRPQRPAPLNCVLFLYFIYIYINLGEISLSCLIQGICIFVRWWDVLISVVRKCVLPITHKNCEHQGHLYKHYVMHTTRY